MLLQRYCSIFVALIAGSYVNTALADCPLREFPLSGTVSAGGAPAAGSRIAVEWTEKQAGVVSVERDSDDSGQFNVPVQYSSFNGRTVLGKERCDFALGSVVVRANKPGAGKVQREVQVKDGDRVDEVALSLR